MSLLQMWLILSQFAHGWVFSKYHGSDHIYEIQ